MNPEKPAQRNRMLKPVVAIVILVVWTVYCHATRTQLLPRLHAVPAFFLGLLVLGLAYAGIRLVQNARRHGIRCLAGAETWRGLVWTVVFAISVLTLFYTFELWRGKRAWATVTREATARGESLDFGPLFSMTVPDDQNFARASFFAPLMTVSNGLPADRDAVLPGDTGQFNFVANWDMGPYAMHHDTGYILLAPWMEAQTTDLLSWMKFFRGWTTNDATPGEPWKSEPIPKITPQEAARLLLPSLRRQFDADLDSLRVCSDRPYCRFPLDYTTQMFSDARPGKVLGGFIRILRLRASAAILAGENDAAFADLRLGLRLVDYVRQQPWACQAWQRRLGVEDTLQPLWEGLATHCWNEQQLADIQARLQALDLLSDYPLAVWNDALALSSFAERIIPTSPATPRNIPSLRPEEHRTIQIVRLLYPMGWSLQDQAAIHRLRLETTSRYIDLNSRRIAGQLPVHRDYPESLAASSDPLFPVFFVPKVREMFSGEAQCLPFAQTIVDLAALACALERHRLAAGSFPPTLDALVPRFIAKIPSDIIDGAPLKYRPTKGGGFVLYSIGLNGTDEGGKPCPRLSHRYTEQFELRQNDWVWLHPDP
jgi:hypothetical protein